MEMSVVAAVGAPMTARAGIQQKKQKRGPAIVCLFPDHWEDYVRFQGAIASLDRNLMDNQTTPLLLFNEGNIPPQRQDWLRSLTKRTVHFPFVNFSEFPSTFDERQGGGLEMKGRQNRWGYWQMCRFWITKVWDHPALANYSTYMRMDTDSCFLKSIPAASPLPGLPGPPNSTDIDFVYAPHLTDHPAFTTKQLLETTQQYLRDKNHTPANKAMWDSVFSFKARRKAMPCFYNNFEVVSIDFFRRPDVMAFQRRITEDAPHGVFTKKWGDAPVRFLTVALFARPEQIAWGWNEQYGHGAECAHEWDKTSLEAKGFPLELPSLRSTEVAPTVQ